MAVVVKRFDVYLINLDPTVGSEIQRTRPCLIISPDEMNRHINTLGQRANTVLGQEANLKLLNNIHHLTFITADMDRLIAFYKRVFGARVTVDLEEEGLRHAFIEVGPHTVLHPFQVPGVELPTSQSMFQRGRLDHFALNAASEEAFRELRRRVIADGAGAGVVTDMGSLLSFSFSDPDGGGHEVVWIKPDVPVGAGLKRANWTKVEMD